MAMPVLGISASDFYVLCPDNEVTREIDTATSSERPGHLREPLETVALPPSDHKAAFDYFLKTGQAATIPNEQQREVTPQ